MTEGAFEKFRKRSRGECGLTSRRAPVRPSSARGLLLSLDLRPDARDVQDNLQKENCPTPGSAASRRIAPSGEWPKGCFSHFYDNGLSSSRSRSFCRLMFAS